LAVRKAAARTDPSSERRAFTSVRAVPGTSETADHRESLPRSPRGRVGVDGVGDPVAPATAVRKWPLYVWMSYTLPPSGLNRNFSRTATAWHRSGSRAVLLAAGAHRGQVVGPLTVLIPYRESSRRYPCRPARTSPRTGRWSRWCAGHRVMRPAAVHRGQVVAVDGFDGAAAERREGRVPGRCRRRRRCPRHGRRLPTPPSTTAAARIAPRPSQPAF